MTTTAGPRPPAGAAYQPSAGSPFAANETFSPIACLLAPTLAHSDPLRRSRGEPRQELAERDRVHRLHEVVDEARRARALDVLRAPVARHRDERRRVEPRHPSYRLRELVPAHPRQ